MARSCRANRAALQERSLGAGLLNQVLKGPIPGSAAAVNQEIVLLYWSIGKDVLERQAREGWGSKVVERLATDLRAEFPEMRVSQRET